MARRVVVTGMGIVSSLGLNLESNWNRLVAGQSGVKPITLFDASMNQTRIAAELPAEFEEHYRKYIKKRAASQMTRVTKMCIVAAKDAVKHAGIDFELYDKTRCSVIIGVVNTGNSSVEKNTTPQNTVFKSMTNAMSAWISLEYQLLGPNFAINTACASSANAMAFGYDMIHNNQADIIIAGGADSIINKEEIQGFNALYALSINNDPPEKASKPFSVDRDGFIIGEGAGVIILESEESANRRGATIYAELAGYGISSEGYNIMAPMKDGKGMAYTIEKALKSTGISKEEVDYINAHGTSTELNDRYETLAIKQVFGEQAYNIPISSSKSMLGHTIGAAGTIEGIVTILSIYHDIVTPTINLDHPDPDLDLDYIPNTSRSKKVQVALSNSFGFGGHNATLVFRKY
ncbi:MAG: beta-ketoacyl-[acyl-carrier-protein] synthase family protein [Bacteroidales bacterium]|nr:beta-ketoacyl-[acyl-carrier-protein] synthase family protein [Bacteroidota bacterium]MBL6949783.1 beta-ketoacyl-[acyl-carrier-protein] synthase family protein [Bacteroidales bacterium]